MYFFGAQEIARIRSALRRAENTFRNAPILRRRFASRPTNDLKVVQFLLGTPIGGASGPLSENATITSVLLGTAPGAKIHLYDPINAFEAAAGRYGLAFYSPTLGYWVPFQMQCSQTGAPESGDCCAALTITLSESPRNGMVCSNCSALGVTFSLYLAGSSRTENVLQSCTLRSSNLTFCGISHDNTRWNLTIEQDLNPLSSNFGKWRWVLINYAFDIQWGKDWTATANPCAGHTLTQAGYNTGSSMCSGIKADGTFITVAI